MMSLLTSNTHMRTVTYAPASSDARASASVHEDKKIAPARRAHERITLPLESVPRAPARALRMHAHLECKHT